MTTEQLTIDQRLTNLELGQARLEAEVLSNTARLDRIEVQLAILAEGQARLTEGQVRLTEGQAKLAQDMAERHVAIVESLAEIKTATARMDERQSAIETRLDRVEDRLDKLDSKYDKILYWVLSLMSVVVAGVLAIAARLVFFPT